MRSRLSFTRRLLALACATTLLTVPAATVAMAATAPSASRPQAVVAAPHRGEVLSATSVGRLSSSQVATYLRETGFPAPESIGGVDLYTLVYGTVTADGKPTTASGVVALPQNRRRGLQTVIYEHGTSATRKDAPSLAVESDGRAIPIAFAAAGFVGVAPDYLGLGTGPGFHPYMHAESEATASVDLLRAARTTAARHGRTLNGEVMVTGFSQGGQAAMALGRALQRGADAHLRLTALAPISGPYDVERAELPAALSGDLDPLSATFYLAYWIVSMNRLYHFYDSPGQVFRAPYDTTMEELYGGDHAFEDIAAGLPPNPRELLTDDFLRRLEHPGGALLRAMRANDTTCTDWRPRVPVRLYGATGDRDVAFANAEHCLRDLRSHGADVSLTNVGDVDHNTSAFRSLPLVLRWFQQLQRH
ncbi:hypothetical protein [Planotetraspora kaengkrachanensis]|uniref:Lipase n=1 Tax=Planotetraspora kaengkrachanensis TaxID=575193 RepID=A0A8J3PUA8_9ACTN|nr:hypothetical protein [Planotetraspora kaengkrachanensis]GIG81174.1 hypothetical protein Pka01_43010 [Planotetraspora kaengkrachanensis]